MSKEWIRFTLAVTVPLAFVLVLVGAAARNQRLNEAVAGGLIAVLGAIVALFAAQGNNKDDNK